MTHSPEIADLRRSARRMSLPGLGCLALLLGGLAAWATLARTDGAVPGYGTLVVEGSLKQIQHPAGGRIAAILVTEGQHVRKGEPLFRLDGTRPRGDLEMIELRLRDAGLRRDRLLAEPEGRNRVAPDGSPQAASEARLFSARAGRSRT